MHDHTTSPKKTFVILSAASVALFGFLSFIFFLSPGFASPSAAPTLIGKGAAANDMAVSTTTLVTATFDTDIDAATVTSTTFAVHSRFFGLVTGTLTTAGTGISLDPAQEFLVGDRLQVIATDNIESDTNDALDNPQQWGFNIGHVTDRCFGAFEDSGTADDALISVYQGSGHWIDADGDGDLDIALTGQTGSGLATQIALNDGTGVFSDSGAADATLISVQDGALAVADYNNDGQPDLLLTGLADSFVPSVQIGRNDAGTFADSGIDDSNLPRLYESSAEWGDYDNDGDLDLLMSGMGSSGATTKVYRNDAGTLVDSGTDDDLPIVRKSAAAWGDYDNDGDLDLVITGSSSTSGFIAQIFEFDGSDWVESGTVDDALIGVQDGAVDWADIDGDGDLDLAIAGFSASGAITTIYENDAGIFRDSGNFLTGVHQGDLAFGDYNNDGEPDLIIIGSVGAVQTAEIYKNNGGVFTHDAGADSLLTGVRSGSVAWGDHDADGDIDLLLTGFSSVEGVVTKLFTNENCSITIDAPSDQAEGNSGNTPFEFTVSRWGDLDVAVTLDYALTSAEADSADFGGSLPSGTVTIFAGDRDSKITINATGDSTTEEDETFTVTLSNPTITADLDVASADATIENDDSRFHIAALAADTLEGDTGSTPFTFTISRTGYLNQPLKVQYTVSGIADGADFNGGALPSGEFLLPLFADSAILTLNVEGDTAVESNEPFTVTLHTPDPGGDIGTATASGIIQNDDGDLDIYATNARQAEGDSGSTPFTFEVVRSGLMTATLGVDYTVTPFGPNPADADDFGGSFITGTLSFATNEITETITINVSGDTEFETNEGFQVTLDNPTGGAVIGISVATGEIENDDTGLAISALNASNAEGEALTFQITRSGNLTGSHSVDYTVSAGGGSYPADAADFGGTFPNGTVTFTSGEATQTITITASADATVEADETITLTLSNPTNNANILTATAAGTIENDDGSISFGPDGLSQTEGNSATITYTYGVTLSEPAVAPISVDYVVSGSGISPANSLDFDGSYPFGTLNFGIGEDTAEIEVVVTGDTETEEDETFSLSLTGVTGGYSLDTSSVTSTIVNDDSSISISAVDAIKDEGQLDDTTPFVFMITRTGDPTIPITADYQVVLNNATADDFTAGIVPSGTISLASNEITQTLTININGDTVVEPTESFDIELSNPTGASIETARATGIIQNDDNGYSISTLTASQPEGNSGNTVFAFKVVRQGTSTTNSSINYAVSGIGLHRADEADFGGFFDSSILFFQSGQTDQEITISVSVSGDVEIEKDETFVVTLSNPTGSEEISTATAFATIENDDEGLIISALPADRAQAEGDSGTTPFNYTLDLIGDYAQTVTVDYAVTGSGDREANGLDFVDGTFPSGTITFEVGTASETLSIPVKGDVSPEPDEGFTIALSNVTSGINLGQSSITGTIQNDDGGTYSSTVYLPFVGVPLPATPDLIVDSITITNGAPTVVIRNIGRLAVTSDFWVDLYINPTTPPTSVNDTIETLQSDGMVWGINASTAAIPPNGSMTLTLDSESLSSQTVDTIPAGATVYVQADSANLSTNYGGVLEGHEIYNNAYNNILSTTAR